MNGNSIGVNCTNYFSTLYLVRVLSEQSARTGFGMCSPRKGSVSREEKPTLLL